MSGPTKKDDARKIVLARRARFVTAAIASVGIACGTGGPGTSTDGGTSNEGGTCEPDCPKPCLSVASDAGPDTSPPQPCLTAPLDSGKPSDGGDEDAGPQPCLAPPPGPPNR